MSEMEVAAKRLKAEVDTCIICSKQSPIAELTSPRDEHSWNTLYQAAEVRSFQPIISKHEIGDTSTFQHIHYHRACRSEFTHKNH